VWKSRKTTENTRNVPLSIGQAPDVSYVLPDQVLSKHLEMGGPLQGFIQGRYPAIKTLRVQFFRGFGSKVLSTDPLLLIAKVPTLERLVLLGKDFHTFCDAKRHSRWAKELMKEESKIKVIRCADGMCDGQPATYGIEDWQLAGQR
jgi:hypothetical protein